MQLFVYIGVALLALLASLPALAHKEHWNAIREFWAAGFRGMLWDLWRCELGAVSVTYDIRGGVTTILNSTTAPTAQQASQVMKQSAVVVFGVTADVQARFTHNWGLDASAPGYFEPEVLIQQLSDVTAFPSLTIDWANTNVLTINKAATNAPVTIVVTLRRPHSMGQ